MWIVPVEEDGDDLMITIPDEVMTLLGLTVGDTLNWEVDENTKQIILTKKDASTIRKEIS